MTGTSVAKAQAGISIDPAARSLAALALDRPLTSDEVADLAQRFSADDCGQAIAAIADQMVPAKVADPKMETKLARRVRDNLGVIGRKIRPDMDRDQARDWIAALMTALSDLPLRISVEATAAAVHTPFEFLSEVEKEIRLKAEEIRVRFNVAKTRLDVWRRRIMTPPVGLPEPEPMKWDAASLAELATTDVGAALIRVAIAGGWVRKNEDGAFVPVDDQENDDA